MADGERREERPPRSLQDLLRLTAAQSNEGESPSAFEEMSEEVRFYMMIVLMMVVDDGLIVLTILICCLC